MSLFSFFQNLFKEKSNAKAFSGLHGKEKADALFHSLVSERRVPGLSVTILKQGETLLQKGYGYANLDKSILIDSKSSLFRIASISKCITGLAFGKMVEEGILDWDDSFYKHVPYYPKKKYDFTLRQLASHTAGIRGYQGKEYAMNKPYSIKESIEVFKEDPLVFEPGKGYLYNSFDFVLLSLAMQEASGVHFEDYVKERLLNPLGMESTLPPLCHAEPVEASENVASNRLRQAQSDTTFYTKRASGIKKAVEVNNFYKLAGGGYLSTSKDIARLGQAIINKELLRPETYQELLKAQTINKKSTYYGLGFQVSEDVHERPFVGHVGSSIGAYTNFYVYPEEEVVISILINCTDPKVQDYINEVLNISNLLSSNN